MERFYYWIEWVVTQDRNHRPNRIAEDKEERGHYVTLNGLRKKYGDDWETLLPQELIKRWDAAPRKFSTDERFPDFKIWLEQRLETKSVVARVFDPADEDDTVRKWSQWYFYFRQKYPKESEFEQLIGEELYVQLSDAESEHRDFVLAQFKQRSDENLKNRIDNFVKWCWKRVEHHRKPWPILNNLGRSSYYYFHLLHPLMKAYPGLEWTKFFPAKLVQYWRDHDLLHDLKEVHTLSEKIKIADEWIQSQDADGLDPFPSRTQNDVQSKEEQVARNLIESKVNSLNWWEIFSDKTQEILKRRGIIDRVAMLKMQKSVEKIYNRKIAPAIPQAEFFTNTSHDIFIQAKWFAELDQEERQAVFSIVKSLESWHPDDWFNFFLRGTKINDSGDESVKVMVKLMYSVNDSEKMKSIDEYLWSRYEKLIDRELREGKIRESLLRSFEDRNTNVLLEIIRNYLAEQASKGGTVVWHSGLSLKVKNLLKQEGFLIR